MADHIQIGDISPRIQFTGDGAQTLFTYPFPIFKDADLKIYEDTTLKTLTTDYTVSGAGNSAGGSATFTTAPANGVIVTLKRQLAIKRTSDFQESGEFRSKVINDELDFLTASLQQVEDDLGRSLRLSATDAANSLELPAKAARVSKFLAFDNNGDPVASDATGAQGPQGPAGNMDGANNLSELTNVATARTNLGVAIGTDVLSPTGDGSGLTGIAAGATDAEKANIILNAFRIAVVGGLSVQNMIDGVVDEFEDETGVDTGTSTNEHYDPDGDNYDNKDIATTPSASGLWSGDFAEATFVGDDVSLPSGDNGMYVTAIIPADTDFEFEALMPATLTREFIAVWSDAETWTDDTVGGGANGGTDSYVYHAQLAAEQLKYQTTVEIAHPVGGAGKVAKFTRTGAGGTIKFFLDDVLTFTFATGFTGAMKLVIGSINGLMNLDNISWTADAGTPVNMTLVSNAVTALAQPDDAFIVLWQEDIDAITLNTDLKAFASRDGGTTWDEITLTEGSILSTGRILSGSVALTSSGTSMKYKIETLNTKEQRLHAVGLEWS